MNSILNSRHCLSGRHSNIQSSAAQLRDPSRQLHSSNCVPARRATTSQENCTRIDNNTRSGNARQFRFETTMRSEMPGRRTSWSSSIPRAKPLPSGQAAIRPTVFAAWPGKHRAPENRAPFTARPRVIRATSDYGCCSARTLWCP